MWQLFAPLPAFCGTLPETNAVTDGQPTSSTPEQRQSAPVFAHAAEAEFAQLLDFYGMRWEYEPRTFVLQRDDQGRVTEAFSPDFYLPDQDLYVELTTMQANQIRHKNRKLRRLRELYPEVNVKLFKRSDIRALLVKFGVEDVAGVIENDL